MKENKLILMEKKLDNLTVVANQLIHKLQQVDVMAKGTLTAFQLHIGEDKWKELVNDLQAIEQQNKKPEEKKFETDVE
tara:strand:- start:7 stop:240 length:234 start_codon:yes stop_codon:yes gene_type:complete